MTATPHDALRRMIIDWLDDNYHFGDAEAAIQSDAMSWLDRGVLDSLGFVKLVIFLEGRLGIKFDRKGLTRENFDGMGKVLRYVTAHPNFRGVP